MAHKKGQGSTQNGRDSNPQFRGRMVDVIPADPSLPRLAMDTK
jgi:hypothetical protein